MKQETTKMKKKDLEIENRKLKDDVYMLSSESVCLKSELANARFDTRDALEELEKANFELKKLETKYNDSLTENAYLRKKNIALSIVDMVLVGLLIIAIGYGF